MLLSKGKKLLTSFTTGFIACFVVNVINIQSISYPQSMKSPQNKKQPYKHDVVDASSSRRPTKFICITKNHVESVSFFNLNDENTENASTVVPLVPFNSTCQTQVLSSLLQQQWRSVATPSSVRTTNDDAATSSTNCTTNKAAYHATSNVMTKFKDEATKGLYLFNVNGMFEQFHSRHFPSRRA